MDVSGASRVVRLWSSDRQVGKGLFGPENLPDTTARFVSTLVHMTKLVIVHDKSGELKSVSSWIASRTMLTTHTKPPSMKIPLSASFWRPDCCRFQMLGMGSRRMAKSVAMFGTELPRRNFVLSTQCPPIIVRFHQKFTGVHWNITTSTWWMLTRTTRFDSWRVGLQWQCSRLLRWPPGCRSAGGFASPS